MSRRVPIPDYSDVIAEFERQVQSHFAFLEDEYGYTLHPSRSYDLHDPRDAWIAIRYKGQATSVDVGMCPLGHGIRLTFRNEKWHEVPELERVKTVSLESVARVRSGGKAKSLLHELTSSRRKSWPQGFLIENLDLAIEKLAWMARRYAPDIIEGHTACFKEIASVEK